MGIATKIATPQHHNVLDASAKELVDSQKFFNRSINIMPTDDIWKECKQVPDTCSPSIEQPGSNYFIIM